MDDSLPTQPQVYVNQNSSVPNAPKSGFRWPIVAGVLIIFFLLIVIALGFFITQKYNSSTQKNTFNQIDKVSTASAKPSEGDIFKLPVSPTSISLVNMVLVYQYKLSIKEIHPKGDGLELVPTAPNTPNFITTPKTIFMILYNDDLLHPKPATKDDLKQGMQVLLNQNYMVDKATGKTDNGRPELVYIFVYTAEYLKSINYTKPYPSGRIP